jgi:hypothetical protein
MMMDVFQSSNTWVMVMVMVMVVVDIIASWHFLG